MDNNLNIKIDADYLIQITTIDNIITEVNVKFLKFTKYDKKDVIGIHINSIIKNIYDENNLKTHHIK